VCRADLHVALGIYWDGGIWAVKGQECRDGRYQTERAGKQAGWAGKPEWLESTDGQEWAGKQGVRMLLACIVMCFGDTHTDQSAHPGLDRGLDGGYGLST
jgi:hypothetical protein